MEPPTSKVYRTGSVEVAVAQRCVRRDGEVLHLRPRSFDLLVYLIERRDRVKALLKHFSRVDLNHHLRAESVKVLGH